MRWPTILLVPTLLAMPVQDTGRSRGVPLLSKFTCEWSVAECVAQSVAAVAEQRQWDSAVMAATADSAGCEAAWRTLDSHALGRTSGPANKRVLVVCGVTAEDAERTLLRMRWSPQEVLLLVGEPVNATETMRPGTLLLSPCANTSACLWELTPPLWAIEAEGNNYGILQLCFIIICLLLVVSALTRYICWRHLVRCGVAVEVDESEVSWSGAAGGAGAGVGGMLSCWLRRLHEFGAPATTPQDNHIKYKGVPVRAFTVPEGEIVLRRRTLAILRDMRTLKHDNVAAFLGVVSARGTLLWECGSRGSLQQVLRNDGVALDWASRLSLLTDLLRGLRYVHGSCVRHHGRLTSRSCTVDARWMLQLADVGLGPFLAAHSHCETTDKDPRELLWTAPELLREMETRGSADGTQRGDIFAVGIVMQEVLLRGEPYCMLPLSPAELVRRLKKPPPLIRPRVPLSAAPPEVVRAMRRCLSERPADRPDCAELLEVLVQLKSRKANMFEMMEKYSNNLEELVRERTQQLVAEKRRTELLLHRMVPRSVAQSLVLGRAVPAQQVADASVLFLDVVGFTRLAARLRPVQVAALLDMLYSRFDKAVRRRRVYKVETVGDAYMLAAGLPEPDERHAGRLARAGMALLRQAAGAKLAVRAGMHCGPVCAAVVGLTLPRYCLFGDTVNTAARMEATGRPRRLQLSAAAARRLRDEGGFRTTYRGKTYIKGKGRMHTYWLLGKAGPNEVGAQEEAIHEDDDDSQEEDEEEEDDESPELDYGEETSESESEGAGPPSPWFPPAAPPRPGSVYREGPQRQFSFEDADAARY